MAKAANEHSHHSETKTDRRETLTVTTKFEKLPQLFPGETVWVPDHNSEATVVNEQCHIPYQVNTLDGTYRRNQGDLV